jgi:hypothetical protein
MEDIYLWADNPVELRPHAAAAIEKPFTERGLLAKVALTLDRAG